MPGLLDSIDSPSDLKKLPLYRLPQLAAEIRSELVRTVSRNGGHLAPSLGAVEIAIALHYCYAAPVDKIVWDVGHQAYAHKLLTGRRREFETLRRFGGISGFPRTAESPYDALSVGHASTSISAGLGMAIARDLRKEKHHVVAVIGDGSLSGGLALEGLNNLGIHSCNMAVVLNDNAMSISRNVGALSKYLTRVITDRRYNKIKNEVWELLGSLSNVGKGIRNLVHSVDDTLKHFIIPGKLFEDMGLRYVGPVDGHNIAELVEVFKFIRDSSNGPVLVHVLTTKGKGHNQAERDATRYHGVKAVAADDESSSGPASPTYSTVFGETLVEMAEKDPGVVAITAGMADGTGLANFRDRFPGRFFDVGIAESHAVTFAAGLAIKGMTPVFAVYSTFLQRAYDQLMHDVALDNLHVVFGVDRAGLVGDDGPTHHGIFDLSFLRTIPNMTIMAPSDGEELRWMLRTAVNDVRGPVCVRYPRGAVPGVFPGTLPEPPPMPRPRLLAEGAACALVSVGDMLPLARGARDLLAASGMTAALVDARFVKPLDEAFYRDLFATYGRIVTLESNTLNGGFGSAVLELAHELCATEAPRVLRLGYPDAFVTHGSKELLNRELNVDPESLARRIGAFLHS